MTPPSIHRAAQLAAVSAPSAPQHPQPTETDETTTMSTTNQTLLRSAFDFSDEENDELALPTPTPISEAKLQANRANAQLSSGPRTSEGKAKASLNSLKTGLTGQTVVLPSEDLDFYRDHIARVFKKYQPCAPDEHMLVQSIADTEWRLARIPALEASIQALGLREFAGEFEDEADPATRQSLIRGKVALHYRKELSNLALQERRLRNHREKDIAEFRELEQARRKRREAQVTAASTLLKLNPDTELRQVGFDFSTHDLNEFKLSLRFIADTTGEKPDFDQFLEIYRNEAAAA